VLLAGVSAAAIGAARRRPYLAAGWLWFLGTLLPVIGLYQARQYPVADRYAYLPQIGLFVIAVWGLEEVGRGRRHGKVATSVVVIALILACVPASRAQVRHWKDDESLFSHSLAVTNDNWVAHLNFGKALMDRGQAEGASVQAREAVRIRPHFAQAHKNLGSALSALGRHGDAVTSFRVAVQLDPRDGETHYNLGTSLASLRRHEEAVASLREAIRLEPTNAKAHANLGFSLAALGRLEEAAASFREAIRIHQAFPEAWYYLGHVQVELGRPGEAARSFREALQIRPNYPEAREWLGRVR
jgi:Flp pilus assembly protein TadD